MATYTSFTSKQGVLVENGGNWRCMAFGSPCIQDVSGSNYGPIIGTVAAGPLAAGLIASDMYLNATVNLADNEFAGATSMSYTIKWHAVVTFQGGNPSTVTAHVWTLVGPLNGFPDYIPYTADGASVTHSGVFGTRPTSIRLLIQANINYFDGLSVTLAFSGISFEIHDVVYDATSTSGTSTSSSTAASFVSSVSSSAPNSATNSTFLSSSASSNTTVSGHTTIIQTLLPQSPLASSSQPHLPLPSNPSSNTSLTVSERAGVIAGSLIGLGLVLVAVAFWYQWWRRRRTLQLEEVPYDDEQNEVYPEARRMDRNPGALHTYRKQTHNRPTIMNANLDEYHETWASEIELARSRRQQGSRPRQREANGSSILALSPPPPTYTLPSTRLTMMTLLSSMSSGEDQILATRPSI